MNQSILKKLPHKALEKQITFAEILATLAEEGVESYHVDFLRNEFRYYATNGESLVMQVPLVRDSVAPEFSPEQLEAINRRVQAGQASYADFVKEGVSAGCAYYVVYLNGKKVRYFGRDGGEYVQYFPGSR